MDYDVIGNGYAHYRIPDPRIGSLVEAALGKPGKTLNVGAGVGSYEPYDTDLVALEPSAVMLAQRSPLSAPAVQGRAENLPFADSSFDAVMSVLSLHHWSDQDAGLRELVRVARRRIVLLSWVGFSNRFWLFDYLPEIEAQDQAMFPSIERIEAACGARASVTPVLIPANCSDGFLCAWWRRPSAYLQPEVRAAISTFARLDNVEERLQALHRDLIGGVWQQRNAELLRRTSMDYGYRVISIELSG